MSMSIRCLACHWITSRVVRPDGTLGLCKCGQVLTPRPRQRPGAFTARWERRLRWLVSVEGIVVARFVEERDAQGFALARFRGEADVRKQRDYPLKGTKGQAA